jgi:tol-pal system protein YbgF
MRFQNIKRKLFLIIGLCLLILSGIGSMSFGQVEGQADSLDDIQNQIIALRNEFKLWIQRAEGDRIAIQKNIKAKLEDLKTAQQSTDTTYPELKNEMEQLQALIESYDESISTLEQTLDSIESTLHDQLDTIEATLGEIKAQGLVTKSRERASDDTHDVEATPSPDALLIDIPAGQLFRAAYRFYMEGDYDTAIAGFQKFLADFPNSDLAGAAQYWIAESLANVEEYEIAIQEYDRLLQKYPQSDKLAAAYYGKALTLLKLERIDEARSLFMYVRDHFPGSIDAKKSENRLTELP